METWNTWAATDSQVKIRGYRIELGEIENALAAHPQVKQVVVIDCEHRDHKILAAYLVFNAQASLSGMALRDYLSARLPDYMLPASFNELNALPLTINGKLDRRALPAPDFIHGDTYVAPTNQCEALLCTIWQAVLGLEKSRYSGQFFPHRRRFNHLYSTDLTTAPGMVSVCR